MTARRSGDGIGGKGGGGASNAASPLLYINTARPLLQPTPLHLVRTIYGRQLFGTHVFR